MRFQTRELRNVNVSKLGFRYALTFYCLFAEWSKMDQALAAHLGDSLKARHVMGAGTNNTLEVGKGFVGRRWFSGTQRWQKPTKYTGMHHYWFVFKTDKDRTLASMIL